MRKLFLLSLCVMSAFAFSQENLGSKEAEALTETQRILTDPQARDKAIAGDPNALNAAKALQDMAGEQSQEVWELASEIMGTLANGAEGNPDKMAEILQRAQTDPAGFAANFTPEQQKKLREIAAKLEAKKGTPKP